MKYIASGWKRFRALKECTVIILMATIIIVVSVFNPTFLSAKNLSDVARTASFYSIIAVFFTLLMSGGAFDISIGSVVASGGLIAGFLSRLGCPGILAAIASICFGGLIGYLIGFLSIRKKIIVFAASIGVQFILSGLNLVTTQGYPIYPLGDDLTGFGAGNLLGIPNVTIVMLVLAALMHVVLNHTSFGRAVCAVGGNRETARLAGINVDRVRFMMHILTSASAALCGVLVAARLGSAAYNAGSGYETYIIAGVSIGGTSSGAGTGTVIGSVLGCFFMTIVTNAMVLVGIDPQWQKVVVGAILIIAMVQDMNKRMKVAKSGS